MKAKRIPYWDNLKAFLIFLVVFAHLLLDLSNQSRYFGYLFNFICMFNMPAFIFVSGYFSRSENSRSGKSILSLVCAYFLFNSVFLLWNIVSGRSVKLSVPYYSYWYLLALIAWRISVPYVSKLKAALPISIVIALIVGFSNDVSNMLALRRIIAFYPFFLAGNMINRDKVNRLISVNYRKRFIYGVLLLLVSAALAFVAQRTFHYSSTDLLMGPYDRVALQPLFGRLIVFVIAAVITLGAMLVTPNVSIPVFSKLGKNTLPIFLIHRPIVLCLDKVIRMLPSSALMFVVIFLAAVAIVVVLGTDFVTKYVNGVLSFGTDVIFLHGGGYKSRLANVVCYGIYIAVAFLVLCAPIIGH